MQPANIVIPTEANASIVEGPFVDSGSAGSVLDLARSTRND